MVPEIFFGRIGPSYIDATYFEPIWAQKCPLLAVIGQKVPKIGPKWPKIMFSLSGTLYLGYLSSFSVRINSSYVDGT